MAMDSAPAPVSKIAFWAGVVLTVLPALMLIMSGVMKLTGGTEVEKGFQHLGWPAHLAVALAVVEFTCTVLYLIPRTAVLGAVLLTGYLGGAIATHVRLEEQFVAPVVLGVVLWFALYLRDARVRALLPFRS